MFKARIWPFVGASLRTHSLLSKHGSWYRVTQHKDGKNLVVSEETGAEFWLPSTEINWRTY